MAKMLQHRQSSAGGALQCVSILRQCMHGLREDAYVQELVTKVNACSSQNNSQIFNPPRNNRAPAYLRDMQTMQNVTPAYIYIPGTSTVAM